MAHHIEIIQMDHQIPLLDQTSVTEIEEGKRVDHLIEIKKTTYGQALNSNKSAKQQQQQLNIISQLGYEKGSVYADLTTTLRSRETAFDKKHIFDKRFKDLKNSSTKSCTIFKLNVALCESNPDAYTPKMISIGPYHMKNLELRSMEKYKLRYLQRFLKRKREIDVASCISEMEKLKDEALKCYDDIRDDDLGSDIVDKFSEMLLLDGCFVVEYIRERSRMKPIGEDIIIKAGCMRSIVRRDLLLLENQLPFFVPTKLHNMTTNHQIPFINMMKKTFLPFLPKMTPASFNESEGNTTEIKYLLQMVHMSCRPSKMKDMPRDKDHLKVMPNAIELSEAGVSFVKVGYIYRGLDEDDLGDSTSLFDVKFENGLMEIPCFEVDDNTETFLRNLIAYEQQSSDVHPTYFSDFATFMDYHIDLEKDVSLLCLKGIIRNNIGEDIEVASLFNKIGKGVSFSDEFYYKEECIKLVQHCEKPWNRMKASLKCNYFSSPWAGASTVAAIVLLILTTMQTVLAFGGVK